MTKQLIAGLCALWALAALALATVAHAQEPVRDTFNYVLGTQTFGPKYRFTTEPALIETARAILAMGSNTIKFRMARRFEADAPLPAGAPVIGAPVIGAPTIGSLSELASRHPVYREIFKMPFAHYLIWAYPFVPPDRGLFSPRRTAADDEREYRELYDFTRHLLQTYNGSGKTFYLGHWEGDWLLSGTGKAHQAPSPERIQAMVRWLNLRQCAVDDARRDTPHQRVEVWHYTEVNLVQKGIRGAPCLTNDVLPRVNVDYVSYSCYDSLSGDIEGNLKKALDHIQAKLPPKTGVPGRRVFIGEYGFPALKTGASAQDALSRRVMRAGLEWGCPFVLYWEMYNNELEADGRQRGFWLIDDKGEKQPVYLTHQRYYAKARQAVAEFRKQHGRTPDAEEFRRAARALIPR